jgi:hypothetical protein
MSSSSAMLPPRTPLRGFRQVQIMQLLWEHGAATVRELHTWLARDERVTSMTVQTELCAIGRACCAGAGTVPSSVSD